jgi:exopolyphosphatase / guanosine-5'-triphosphate,3'-diphosphate pyrophosphatase
MRRIAILDLGTNTFHLLIVEERTDGRFEEILKKRIYVKLALDGIDLLSEAAMERGIQALSEFNRLIREHQTHEITAIGTAALRTATNAPDYLRTIKTITNVEVQLIDGQEEARLIYLGVSQVWFDPEDPVLIMDIGGGSVEFIIADKDRMHWSVSYPVGVAVLYRNFHRSEPISNADQTALDQFLDDQLSGLKEMLARYRPSVIVGASGTFDVLGTMIGRDPDDRYHEVDDQIVYQMIQEIVLLNEEERALDSRIPVSRIDMIVVALLLLRKVLSMGSFRRIGISAYALKEGIAVQYFSRD